MDYAAARFKMVENQVRTNRVTDPLVIAALNELPRETFLPDSLKGVAYVDEDIPLGGGRYLMEPLATALILQTAEIEPEDKILVVACGTGYLAAAAARIGRVVVALEEDSNIAAGARENISQTGASAVTVVEGRLAEGYPPEAPYDVILFNGAAADVPSAILDQLAEGGRLVAIIAAEHGLGRGTVFYRIGGTVSRRVAFDSSVPLLAAFAPMPRFQF
ncbi:MAG: protein-L-isoaspartate O-methyltransferase [Rhodospirillales bacterium]